MTTARCAIDRFVEARGNEVILRNDLGRTVARFPVKDARTATNLKIEISEELDAMVEADQPTFDET